MKCKDPGIRSTEGQLHLKIQYRWIYRTLDIFVNNRIIELALRHDNEDKEHLCSVDFREWSRSLNDQTMPAHPDYQNFCQGVKIRMR